jgi:hypothetical protein
MELLANYGNSYSLGECMIENDPHNRKIPLSVTAAIIIGQLVVNLPAVALVLGIALVGRANMPSKWWLFIIAGFLLGWFWWSFSISRWRKWALNQGCPSDKLRQWAGITGLEWPEGSVFAKTDTKGKK